MDQMGHNCSQLKDGVNLTIYLDRTHGELKYLFTFLLGQIELN